MPDAITDLGHCAAVCELEAFLCPWDRVELEQRANAYRGEQLRLLAQLAQLMDSKSMPPRSSDEAARVSESPNRQLWGSRGVFA